MQKKMREQMEKQQQDSMKTMQKGHDIMEKQDAAARKRITANSDVMPKLSLQEPKKPDSKTMDIRADWFKGTKDGESGIKEEIKTRMGRDVAAAGAVAPNTPKPPPPIGAGAR